MLLLYPCDKNKRPSGQRRTIVPLFYREKKKELDREELWRKLEELKLKKTLPEQASTATINVQPEDEVPSENDSFTGSSFLQV